MDDAEPTVPPDAATPDAPPTGKPAPPMSRAIAMFAIVFVFFGLLAAAAWFIGGGATPEDRFCTTEGLIRDGVTYGRDLDQDCKFVDGAGNLMPGQ